MSTPNQQRSRYPRPLKATHSFTSSGEPTTGNNGAASGTGGGGGIVSGSCLPSPPPRDGPNASVPSGSAGNGSCEAANVSVSGKTIACGGSPPASPNTGRSSGSARRDQFGK